MAQNYTITSNSSTAGLPVEGKINFAIFGSFGGGTVSVDLSYDGGTTWFSATNEAGTAVAVTSSQALNIQVGESNIRFTLAGATAPSITVSLTGIDSTSRL
tara:strand:- start:786 stop:1088 length:303 start_codon:yes stop_codon:yes gene_type:complete